MTELLPLGDHGFLARFPGESEASGWARALRDARLPSVTDVVAAFRTVAVAFDPDLADPEALEVRLGSFRPGAPDCDRDAPFLIPVLYDGPDLGPVARTLGLSSDALIETHSGVDYRVQAIGFLPGFPYAGDLPDGLCGLPRRATPRPRVSAGSVAIVGRQTAIYPGESPGGWHLIGRTPLRIADPDRAHFPIQTGDRLRFVPIGPQEFDRRQGEPL